MRANHQLFLSCLSVFFLFSLGVFHCGFADDAKSTLTVNEQLSQLETQVSQARILMQTGKAEAALLQLRAAADDSWKVLFSVSGTQNVLTSSEPIPTTGIISRVARQAANVHYWWGEAARKQSFSDEAITAFARAARLNTANNNALDLLSGSIRNALVQSLQNGFPQSAAPDVLANIAQFSDGEKGQTKSDIYEISNPVGSVESTFFIWTEGNIHALSPDPQTAPLYRNIPASQLPAELKSTQILYTYTIPAANYYSGLASLQLKVRFSDPKDAGLASHLAQMMLRIKLMNDHFLNRKAAPLTLWLETVSADWPKPIDENSPWEAAAKIDSAPNDIMIFRVHEPRTDSEWMRELIHEYGHVAWPEFSSFAPPLEPNANGMLSETMGPVWLAENMQTDEANIEDVYLLIDSNALKTLPFWLEQGPESNLADGDNSKARQYLQGLCVYIDRVYGSQVLSDIMEKLRGRNNTAKDIEHLIPEIIANNDVQTIYLPAAAINAPLERFALIHRSTMNYSDKTKVEFQVYIPIGTTQLKIPWTGDGKISNKSTFGTSATSGQVLTLTLKGTSGWQKLAFQVDGEIRLGNATFVGE